MNIFNYKNVINSKISNLLKNQNMNGKTSIRRRLILIFILIILVITIVFTFSILRRNTIGSVYQENADINLKLNQFSFELSNNARAFNLYFKTGQEEQRENYILSRKKLNELLGDLRDYIIKDEKSYIFFRNLTNMLVYHDQLVEQIFSDRVSSEERYEVLTNIRTLYTYMNRHAQTLIISYSEYSNKRYMNLLDEFQNIERKIYIIVLIISLICLSIAFTLARGILNTMNSLSRSARSLSKGHWEIPDIEENKFVELNILGQTFNLMKHNIKKFIGELKHKSELESKLNKQRLLSLEKDRLLKESQLMNLQMQMDPHFLFNTLNTVARTAMFEDAKKTEKLIVAISKILRYNLDNKGKMVELGKEIEVLKAYLTIQQTRFQSQMRFNIDISGEISGIMIPPMILQPIVENAIIHGLADMDKDGKIDILIRRVDKYIEVEIADNGRGIESENLELVFNDSNRDAKKGMGLLNVKKRLDLQYGEELISIDSEPGRGTTVIIRIPLNKGDMND